MTIMQYRAPRVVFPADIQYEENETERTFRAAYDMFGEEHFMDYIERQQRDLEEEELDRLYDYMDMAQEHIDYNTRAIEEQLSLRNEWIRHELESSDMSLLSPVPDQIFNMSAGLESQHFRDICLEAFYGDEEDDDATVYVDRQHMFNFIVDPLFTWSLNESHSLSWLDFGIDLADHIVSMLYAHVQSPCGIVRRVECLGPRALICPIAFILARVFI